MESVLHVTVHSTLYRYYTLIKSSLFGSYVNDDYFRLLDIASGLSDKSFNQGYYKKFFVEVKSLGKGYRGSVFLCNHRLDGIDLGYYAIKKVPIGDNHVWLTRMLREVKILERLHHENIIMYKHSWIEQHQLTRFGPEIPCLFILMELANGGNLEEHLENNRLSEKEVLEFFQDVTKGLAHLHHYGIIHRDLKPNNLLLQFRENQRPIILLSDFGECEMINATERHTRTGATGTLEFMAPELLEVDPTTNAFLDSYTTLSDIWSLGMVAYYLCFHKLPFTNENIDQIKKEILLMDDIAVEAQGFEKHFAEEFIRPLLRKVPERRPDCQTISTSIEKFRMKRRIPDSQVVKYNKQSVPVQPQSNPRWYSRENIVEISVIILFGLIASSCHPFSVHWSLIAIVLCVLIMKRLWLFALLAALLTYHYSGNTICSSK